MDGGKRRRWPSWKTLKRRVGWNRINLFSFCGSSKWVLDTDAGEQPFLFSGDQSPSAWDTTSPGSCIGGGATMNLATALAAERRKVHVESTDWMIVKVAHDGDDVGGGIGTLCCLCTERNKGAALIPCGHTYCRACSRGMWSKRKACPLCNRSITDVLEIL
ncbi:putative transcription factor C2H2 family [Helianthus annuus]|nr:putative transcription factor C2H2 family [Helianthus annuus]